jgi:hypothetical protein
MVNTNLDEEKSFDRNLDIMEVPKFRELEQYKFFNNILNESFLSTIDFVTNGSTTNTQASIMKS